jgi:hypothetical protein
VDGHKFTKRQHEEGHVIEVTKAMLEEKARQARGDAPLVEDKICQAFLDLDLPEFRKLSPMVQTWCGFYATAQRRAAQLAEVA